MTFRSLDQDGDWVFGNGLQAYAKENQAIQLNISTTLKTILTECFFDQTLGVAWFQLLSGGSAQALVLAVKSAIYNVDGVTSITDLKYYVNPSDRSISITYFVSTIYTTQVSGTVNI